ncbi:MAG TPA: hypothetical protein PKI19_10720 [Elusimicrobiales bacterium]|nr:hypothetical protein [Elusimicrobiales bacterium]
MSATEPGLNACWSCGGKVDDSDAYCRHCGKGLSKNIPWYYGHAGIILLTVTVLGPFSLRLVWKSPRLSANVKWAYTVGILLLTWYAGSRLYSTMQNAAASLGRLPAGY